MIASALEAQNLANVTIELDIFSGRPNPSWVLEDEDRKKLLKLLSADRSAKDGANDSSELGYRGFFVRITSELGKQEIHVGNGSIEIGRRFYHDAERMLERFIIASMPKDLKAQFQDVLPK
jgi:hypothetical protein